jgi:hypothetical protein
LGFGPSLTSEGGGPFFFATVCENRTVQQRQQQHDDGDDRVPIVPYVAFRCPTCGRHKPTTYKVRGRLRYHRCRSCGQRYRSFEVGPDSVGSWTAPPVPAT